MFNFIFQNGLPSFHWLGLFVPNLPSPNILKYIGNFNKLDFYHLWIFHLYYQQFVCPKILSSPTLLHTSFCVLSRNGLENFFASGFLGHNQDKHRAPLVLCGERWHDESNSLEFQTIWGKFYKNAIEKMKKKHKINMNLQSISERK